MNDERKVPLISLQEMTNFQAAGGAGVHDLAKRNVAFGGKLVWQMYHKPHSTWCKIIQHKYLDNTNPLRFLTISNPPKGFFIWEFMMSSREIVVNYIT